MARRLPPLNALRAFEAAARQARTLCQAESSAVLSFDGEWLHMMAIDHVSLEGKEALRRTFPIRVDQGSAIGRALLTRQVVHIADIRRELNKKKKNRSRTDSVCHCDRVTSFPLTRTCGLPRVWMGSREDCRWAAFSNLRKRLRKAGRRCSAWITRLRSGSVTGSECRSPNQGIAWRSVCTRGESPVS